VTATSRPRPPPERDQQGSTRYLNPNPLTSRCLHTSNYRFTTTATLVQDVDAVVNDALSKSGLSKVNLLGYSAGGIDVGNYLGEANDTVRAARTAKIERAIFVSSLFGATGVLPPVVATEPTNVPTAPMGVSDKGNVMAAFNLDPTCPGQQDPGIPDAIWAAVKGRDSVGSGWGASGAAGGLARYPIASRWGWNGTAAARISVPTLVMNGLIDKVVGVNASPAIYSALTGTTSKTLVQVGCASHYIFEEGCSGTTCNGWKGPHETVAKNVRDWVNTGMIYASPGSSNGTFASTSDDGENTHTESPITNGPTVDETLNW
jgi:pimeloyl-ACP methyl ester carboxylesterase